MQFLLIAALRTEFRSSGRITVHPVEEFLGSYRRRVLIISHEVQVLDGEFRRSACLVLELADHVWVVFCEIVSKINLMIKEYKIVLIIL